METTGIQPVQLYSRKESSRIIFEKENDSMWFDLKDKKFYQNKGEKTWQVSPQVFFRKISVPDILSSFRPEDATYVEILKIADIQERRCSNLGTILQRSQEYWHLESYLLLDIKFSLPISYRGQKSDLIFTKPVSQFTKPVIQWMKGYQGVFGSRCFQESFHKKSDLFTNLCNFINEAYPDNPEVNAVLYGILCSSTSFATFCQLTVPSTEEMFARNRHGIMESIGMGYGCNYRTLFNYLMKVELEEVTQPKDSLTLLRDYLKMNRDMGRTTGEKYPQYLQLQHDLLRRNYNKFKFEYDEELFVSKVDRDLNYQGKNFIVKVPEASLEVKNEGIELQHCVASYISNIIQGSTQIVFLRQNHLPEKSLVTIEVNQGRISQVKGFLNRKPMAEEIRWVTEFAAAKGLSYTPSHY